MRDATLDQVMEFKANVAKLDEVGFSAIIAVMQAMAHGLDNEAAAAIGDAILVNAGRKPILGGTAE